MRTRNAPTRRSSGPLAVIGLAALGACGGRDDSAATQTSAGTSGAQPAWVAPRSDSTRRPVFPADTPTTGPARTPRPPGAPGAPTTGAATPATPSSTATTPRPTAASAPATSVVPSTGGRASGDTARRTDTANTAAPAPEASPAVGPPPIPRRAFSVGERLTYEVRFGPIPVGQATMEVLGIEQLRGRDAYHTRFTVRGGTAFYRVNDRYESWFDARTLESLRYAQEIDQGSYERERLFEMFPERRTFTEAGRPEHQPSVADPLDDGSFLYFLRTIPLEVGTTYEFNRYFRPDRNPVRVTVLRREPVEVPAGKFDAIVVRPIIKTRGIFSEGGRAEVWFADDSTRRMLQMKSRLSFGTLNLYLRRVEP